MTTFNGVDEVIEAEGKHLGYSDWMTIDQERINTFADATGDHQWIHVDPEKAKDGPFGSTIAHGYLTMSLSNAFLPTLINVENVSMGINYGVNKVRFPAPVPVDSEIRAGAELASVEEIDGGVQCIIKITMERKGADRPVCVIESVTRYMR
jgi:acyl dehydratase